jgi:ATP synthase protein I
MAIRSRRRNRANPRAGSASANVHELAARAHEGIFSLIFSDTNTPGSTLTWSTPLSMVRPASMAAAARARLNGRGCRNMVDDARKEGDQTSTAEEVALSARLHRLGKRLDQIHPAAPTERGSARTQTADPSAIARGFRMSAELVGGVVLGAGIGWLIDLGLGISPWGMMVFLLLGFAAGVLNVMRSAGVLPANRIKPPGST